MAPFVDFTTCATPELPWPACVSAGHSTVEPDLSFQVPAAAASRYLVKLSVVPEPSARRATTMSVAGSLAPGLSDAIAGSFHFFTSRWKILASVSGDRLSLLTSSRL